MQFETVRVGKVFDEALVGIGFCAAELVVYMGNRKNNAKFAAQINQQKQKRHGIGAAGNGCGNAVSGLDQTLLAN